MPGLSDAFFPAGSVLLSLTSLGTTAYQPTTGYIGGLQIENMSTSGVVILLGNTSTIVATAGSSAGFINGMFVIRGNSGKTISCPPNTYLSACTTAASLSAVIYVTPGVGIP